jgi:hypothetical protein
MTPINGIAGLEGREPIGAAVTIGVKGPSGAPIERDRFHVVEVNEDGDGRRPLHRAFSFFNDLKAPDKRRLLRGNLVHANRRDCFEFNLRAQQQPGGKMHPQKRPFCVGDGVRAVRWMGKDADDFKEIECPHDRCEFRQAQGAKPTPCKPWMRLLFRIAWDDATQDALKAVGRPAAPSMIVKFTSGSWNTTRNVLGFFEQFEQTAAALGIPNAKLFGLPFTMQLGERTNSEKKSRFPVVTLSPAMDLIEFLGAQKRQLDALGAVPVYEALTDQSQNDPRVVHADYQTTTAGIPGC